jgi:hypothetical protein
MLDLRGCSRLTGVSLRPLVSAAVYVLGMLPIGVCIIKTIQKFESDKEVLALDIAATGHRYHRAAGMRLAVQVDLSRGTTCRKSERICV